VFGALAVAVVAVESFVGAASGVVLVTAAGVRCACGAARKSDDGGSAAEASLALVPSEGVCDVAVVDEAVAGADPAGVVDGGNCGTSPVESSTTGTFAKGSVFFFFFWPEATGGAICVCVSVITGT
jgi:hypothetical protein